MKTLNSALILATVFFVACIVFYTPQAQCADYQWTIQSAFPRGDGTLIQIEKFADFVEKNSNGRLKIKVYAAPELVEEQQLLDGVRSGVVDMAFTIGAFWGGIIPAATIEFGLPFQYRMPKDANLDQLKGMLRKFMEESGFKKILREEYAKYGVYYLDAQSIGSGYILSKQPMLSIKDFQGKKMAVAGPFGDFYTALGARGVLIPGGDTYLALKLGTIEGVQWDVTAVTGMKWNEVASYRIRGQDNDTVPSNLLVNMGSWNKLPDDLKKVVENAALKFDDYITEFYKTLYKQVDDEIKAGKLTEVWIDKDCEAKSMEAAMKVREMYAKEPVQKELLKIVDNWKWTE
jgi:TRAP-type C4-dicarboxylate transport system substrate-binding protein